jgi:hypothetical protein
MRGVNRWFAHSVEGAPLIVFWIHIVVFEAAQPTGECLPFKARLAAVPREEQGSAADEREQHDGPATQFHDMDR